MSWLGDRWNDVKHVASAAAPFTALALPAAVAGGASSIGSALGGVGQNSYTAQTPNINRQDFNPGITQAQGQSQDNAKRMNQFADVLKAQMSGSAPNPALEQLRQTTNQNIGMANSLIASQRGVNPALAARAAASNAGNMNQQAASQAAQLLAQQQLGTQQQLGQLYGTMGEQGLQQQQILQGANAAQNNAINSGQLGAQGINASVATANAANSANLLGGVIGGAGAIGAAAAMSDRRLKKNVADGGGRIEKFLDAVKPMSYDYKDARFGGGRQVSPMAQDLEKTPVGKAMITDTPSGKMVDYGKGLGAILAATADIHHRLKKIEEARGGKRSA